MDDTTIDYQQLLTKYIQHLSFLGNETLIDDNSILDSIIDFSEQELEQLRNIPTPY